jgi:hypothetical protein
MLEFFTDISFVIVSGWVFQQQSIGISMDTNCAHLLADLFLHSYEAGFIQKLHVKTNSFDVALDSIYQLAMINSIYVWIRYIPMKWK